MDTNEKIDELQELQRIEGLNVWGQHQDVIEKQALEHLESLVSQEKYVSEGPSNVLEEGEIPEIDCQSKEQSDNPNVTKCIPKTISHITLDLDKYIQSQTVLKENKVVKIDNSVSNRSKQIAECISKKQTDKEVKISKRKRRRKSSDSKIEIVTPNSIPITKNENSDSEYVPSEDDQDSDYEIPQSTNSKHKRKRKIINDSEISPRKIVFKKIKDDGNMDYYQERLKHCNENKSCVSLTSAYNPEEAMTEILPQDVEQVKDKVLENGLKVPGAIWNKLFRYQKVGVKWLWELHQQKVGGLLGDEMGLGKTVQIIGFLAAVDYSGLRSGCYNGLGPTIIVCPTTVLHQWVQHFHTWWPPLRVAILHQSGSFSGNFTQLIKDMNKCHGILVTTYLAILRYQGLLTELHWQYVILDEGHKIRNPGAKVSIAVKKIRTPHRIILTGSPMQNNLTELWSLFDFIVPGKLGSQQVFLEHFANPIVQGGYANATPMQEATALSMATALKNLITPYMLRRAKAEVRDTINLSHKTEQVLFCSLTDEQRDLYKGYLMAEHVSTILDRGRSNWHSDNYTRAKMLVALSTLRKICNHPDLYLGEMDLLPGERLDENFPVEETFGYFKRAGKMVVVAALLRIWKRQEHRVLLFTQSRAMITIFENFLTQHEYSYLKMDGSTSIGSRQPLIEKFNQNPEYFIFLLTTRVGGLGINLTGANRVIIYDPDWNPATDTQARERAWRIGQEKQVTVYRLLSAGTIEEKMYQRQVWKQLLSNKVLLDPKQKRFFKTSDLFELFSFQEPTTNTNIETANIFQNSKVNMDSENGDPMKFSDNKIQAMKALAQKLAKTLSSETSSSNQANQSVPTKKDDNKEEQKDTKADENFVFDPSTIRFKHMRKIILPSEEPETNKFDDSETSLPFSAALEVANKITEKKLHKIKKTEVPEAEDELKLKKDKHLVCKNSGIDSEKDRSSKSKSDKKQKLPKEMSTEKEHKKKSKRIDLSGIIDGEKVEGLVKREKKKLEEKQNKRTSKQQDEYVLGKLFSKGVHTALKHDTIVQSGYEEKNSLRIRNDAQLQTRLALKALKKSKLKKINDWRW